MKKDDDLIPVPPNWKALVRMQMIQSNLLIALLEITQDVENKELDDVLRETADLLKENADYFRNIGEHHG